MSSIEVLAHQPDFPNEDLSDKNIAFVEFYLKEYNAERAYAEKLEASMRPVHAVAHEALRICGVEVDYSPDEYEAFCRGFAAFDYISMLVNPRIASGTTAIKNTEKLLIDPGELADFSLAERRDEWIRAFPNTYGAIVDTGARRGETMKQLQTRAMGAQIACELEMTS